MTAPKEPARAKTPTALDKPALVLTPAEMSLLMAHRVMDDEAKIFTLDTARSQARLWPLDRPTLRLVGSNPKQ